ncbi:Histidine kinase [Rhodovastum atsumiense]|uniref:Signal transduction histidine-protein kinase/phosphatase MprB n=1 Tax=Rhodovastum atsumiense TaxID=504468 RepID=A0A5M6J2F7_9PROT|nr:HAMP domain-containing sensor histidine kinase [Rhodovastum atsumiense]KAA5614711.1 HAMP domain-containing histidine kinase [Rhodovastum atsumiense]CAH2599753.1 Histidine kinase [Rhodovastum atsumiense]
MRSLRSRLALLWALSLAASLAVGAMLVSLYRASAMAQAARAEAVATRICDVIDDRWGFYAAGWAGPAPPEGDASFRHDLSALLAGAVPLSPALEAGIWREGEGMLARRGTALGPPDAAVLATVGEAVSEERQALRRQDSLLGPVGIAACPLAGPVANLVAYVAVTVPEAEGPRVLQAGLAVLLALMLAMAALITWLQRTWARHVRGIAAALAAPESGELPRLAPTGERELDRIVAALDLARTRLAEARQRSEELAARVALSERLAALGRVAAGVAHEIRNPIAAMRLKAENALAGDEARRRAALEAILAQIARLDRLIGELLAMTQRRTPAPEAVDLPGFLAACAADHPRVAAMAPAGTRAVLDPALTRRALDSLLANARQLSPAGATVRLHGEVSGRMTRITVADDGPGVPAALRATLFEPFVTGRADGTGLGLAIARELAEAQGGTLLLADPGGEGRGATFLLELPAPEPHTLEPSCPAS